MTGVLTHRQLHAVVNIGLRTRPHGGVGFTIRTLPRGSIITYTVTGTSPPEQRRAALSEA